MSRGWRHGEERDLAVWAAACMADEYRVRVWPSRRLYVAGAWGWRAQVDHTSGWDEHGDVPMIGGGRRRWHRCQCEAVTWAVAEARAIHAGDGCVVCDTLGRDLRALPLRVHIGPVAVVDDGRSVGDGFPMSDRRWSLGTYLLRSVLRTRPRLRELPGQSTQRSEVTR